jgi:hypothetical protein
VLAAYLKARIKMCQDAGIIALQNIEADEE